MTLSWKYRLHQSFWYEGLALLWVLPIVQKATGASATVLFLLIFLSTLIFLWTALFNVIFDKFFQPPSPDNKRSWRIRILHVFSFEISAVLLTVPIVAWWTNIAITQAIALSVKISLFYVVYTYVFFLVWDNIVVYAHRRKSRNKSIINSVGEK